MGKVIKFETKAWASDKYAIEGIFSGDTTRVQLSAAKMEELGWIEIGTAVVEMTLRSPEEMTAGQIQAIQDEIESERAAHQVRINYLQSQLQNLLALPCEVQA